MSRLRLNQPLPDCVAGQLDSVAHANLFSDAILVTVDRLRRQMKLAGDLFGCVAGRKVAKYLDLAIRQTGKRDVGRFTQCRTGT